MRSLLVLSFTLYLMWAGLRTPYMAMLLYWWFAVFRPQDRIWWDVQSLRLPLIAFAIFCLSSFIRGYYPAIRGVIGWLVVLWLALASIAHFAAGCGALGPLGNALQYMAILIFAITLTVRTIEEPRHILYLVFIVSIPFGYFSGKAGFNSIMSGGASAYGASDFTGIFTGSNAAAMGIGMLIFFMLFILWETKNPQSLAFAPKFLRRPIILRAFQIAIAIMIGSSFYYIVSVESRGSFISTSLSLVLFALLSKLKIHKLIYVLPILLVLAPFVPLPEGYKERIQSAFADKEELDPSAASRPHFWSVARLMVADNPLGVGPGCYSYYYDRYDTTGGFFGKGRAVHSSHFQMLSEIGYMGATVWALLILVSFYKLFKLRRIALSMGPNIDSSRFYVSLCNALICSQTTFVLGGSFYEIGFSDLIWLNWGLIIALEKLMTTTERSGTGYRRNSYKQAATLD